MPDNDPKFDKGVFVIFTPFFALLAIPLAHSAAVALTHFWQRL